VQPVLGDPALAWGLDYMIHRGSFQPLLFCDSVIQHFIFVSVSSSYVGNWEFIWSKNLVKSVSLYPIATSEIY